MKAFLDRPSQPTQETKKNFEVMDLVDINTPDLMVRFILKYHGSEGEGGDESHVLGITLKYHRESSPKSSRWEGCLL